MKKTRTVKSFNFVYNWLGLIPFEKSLAVQEELKSSLSSSVAFRSADKGEFFKNSQLNASSKEELLKNSQLNTSSKEELLKNSQLNTSSKESQFCFLGFEVTEPVITLGLRADESHVLFNSSQLKENKLSILKLKRGGEATLHAPGQLVIYPVLSLPRLGLKVKDFIVMLEEITQSVLKDFGIETKKEGNYAGLYTERGKICFFGIHISRGVSQHGVSINVNNDLNLFRSIKSCGEQDRQHDSLSLYPCFSLSKEELFLKWCEKAVFLLTDKIDNN